VSPAKVSKHEQQYNSLLFRSLNSTALAGSAAHRGRNAAIDAVRISEQTNWSEKYLHALLEKQETGLAEAAFFVRSSGFLQSQAPGGGATSAAYSKHNRKFRRSGWWQPQPPTVPDEQEVTATTHATRGMPWLESAIPALPDAVPSANQQRHNITRTTRSESYKGICTAICGANHAGSGPKPEARKTVAAASAIS
jgi:heme/copper-type cytochrome/quinol oxidase subunit 2